MRIQLQTPFSSKPCVCIGKRPLQTCLCKHGHNKDEREQEGQRVLSRCCAAATLPRTRPRRETAQARLMRRQRGPFPSRTWVKDVAWTKCEAEGNMGASSPSSQWQACSGRTSRAPKHEPPIPSAFQKLRSGLSVCQTRFLFG